jgi:hypothetical protein
MNYFPNHGHGLHRLIYVSRSNLSGDDVDRDIGEIVASAAANNSALAVTGALLATHGWFVQVLEGSYATLKPLFDTIAADRRHRDVDLKLVEAAQSRLFEGWSMRQVNPPADEVQMDISATSGKDLIQLLSFIAHMAEAKRPKPA